MTRLAQEGKGSSTDARETNDVDIKDAMPLLVIEVLDQAQTPSLMAPFQVIFLPAT